MKNKFDSGIEISSGVLKSSVPIAKIKRYSNLKNKTVKKSVSCENVIFRYRPGINSSITGDLDV